MYSIKQKLTTLYRRLKGYQYESRTDWSVNYGKGTEIL